MISSILSSCPVQGEQRRFSRFSQIRLQAAAFIYKTRKSRSVSIGLFLGYSRNLQSSHFFPEHLLLVRPLRKICLQGKKFWLQEEEQLIVFKQIKFINIFFFFFFFSYFNSSGNLKYHLRNRFWNKAIQPFVSQLR